MNVYVMMYVREMLSGYARVWENKPLTVTGDFVNILSGRDAEE